MGDADENVSTSLATDYHNISIYHSHDILNYEWEYMMHISPLSIQYIMNGNISMIPHDIPIIDA
jgi:hypothetical protein